MRTSNTSSPTKLFVSQSFAPERAVFFRQCLPLRRSKRPIPAAARLDRKCTCGQGRLWHSYRVNKEAQMAINQSRRNALRAGLAGVVAAGTAGRVTLAAQTRGAAPTPTPRLNGPLFFDVET